MTSELRTLYMKHIIEMTKIEQSIVRHLPDLIKATSNSDLRNALTEHLEETKKQYSDMQNIAGMESEQEDQQSSENNSFEKMMQETSDTLAMLTDSATIDAFIIAAGTTVEHIEMAKYETLIAWAEVLDDTTNQSVFERIRREEEKAAENLKTVGAGSFLTKGILADAAADGSDASDASSM